MMKQPSLILFLYFTTSSATSDSDLESSYLDPHVVHNASLNHLYSAQVNQSTEYLYEFTYTPRSLTRDSALRVYVESDGAVSSAPVLVVIRYKKGVLSWQLPMETQDPDDEREVIYTAVNRTLCPDDDGQYAGSVEDRRVRISISTASLTPVKFSVSLYEQPQYIISINTSYSTLITPSAPQYFRFTWPEHVDTAIIHVTSPQAFCMIISVQNVTCPVYDLDRNVNFEGSYQTADTKAGMSIRRDQYPHGVHLVFVEKATNRACSHYDKLPERNGLIYDEEDLVHDCHGPCREKHVSFIISKKITKNEYLVATFGAFFMFIGAYVIVVLVSCILCVRQRKVPSERTLFDRSASPVHDYQATADNEAVGGVNTAGDDLETIETVSEDSSIDEDDIDMLTDADHDKDVFR